jgi:uncharacterized membrane protein
MPQNRFLSGLMELRSGHRLAIAVATGILAMVLQPERWGMRTNLLVSWDTAALIYLLLAWTIIAKTDAATTRAHVQSQDQSGQVIFLLVVIAACASIVAIGMLVGNVKQLPFWLRTLHIALSIAALMLSWLLIQTLFGFHYARRFYARASDSEEELRGLRFPGDEDPDYLDFAYYSFVVGMTSQVSDVTVTTRQMRRLTMTHGVLSFVFNIAILAMSINIIGTVL